MRELENAIYRGMHLARDGKLKVEDLQLALVEHPHQPEPWNELPLKEAKRRCVLDFERRYVIELMKRFKGNVSLAARVAGKERRALGKLLKKHCIDPKRFSRPV